MEALSTHPHYSSLLPKSFIPHHHLKHSQPPPSPSPIPTSNIINNNLSSNNYLLTKPLSYTSSNSKPPLPTTISSPSRKQILQQPHRKATTGYAAALLDVVICDGVDLRAVAKDARRVKRVMGLVMGDERVQVEEKGEVVKRVVESGGCYGRLVMLVKMMVERGKVGMVGEVMEEFGRLQEEIFVGLKITTTSKDKACLVF